MVFSMKDIYTTSPTGMYKTAEQSIPEATEESHYMDDETAINSEGQLATANKSSIWIAILVIMGVLFVLHLL